MEKFLWDLSGSRGEGKLFWRGYTRVFEYFLTGGEAVRFLLGWVFVLGFREFRVFLGFCL